MHVKLTETSIVYQTRSQLNATVAKKPKQQEKVRGGQNIFVSK